MSLNMNETSKKYFFYGVKKSLPLVSGILPFGLIYSTVAMNAGMAPWLVLLFSVVVFAGSSQLIFIDLVGPAVSPFQAVIGAQVANARHLIYGARMSSRFKHMKKPWPYILGYLMTDQLFAVAEKEQSVVMHFESEKVHWFYFGSGFCIWLNWLGSNVLGIFFGLLIPTSWNLEFAIPLIFLPFIFSKGQRFPALFAAVLSFTLMSFLNKMPWGLGVFTSIIVSCSLVYFIEKILKQRKKSDVPLS